MQRSFVALCLLAALLTSPVYSQTAPAQAQESKWTVDDVIMVETAGGFQISPDGRRVVWVKGVPDKEKNGRIQNLILSSLTEKGEIELTRGNENSFNPKWSPDGKVIGFISTRPSPKKPAASEGAAEDGPRPQLWLINSSGGEAWAVTEFARGVSNFEWVDGDTIVFAAQEDPSLYEKVIKEKKDTTLLVEDEPHAPPVRLFKFSIKAKRFTRLTDNADRIQYFSLSPDGGKAVTIHDRSLRYVFDNKIKPIVFLYDLATGERRQIFEARTFNISGVRWARDGRGFYATSEFTNHPEYVNATVTHLYYYDLATGAPSRVELDWENGLAGDFDVTADGFIALMAAGARNRLARYKRDGNAWRREWVAGDHASNIFAVEMGKDGQTLVYSYSTASTPTQWYRARLADNLIETPAQVTEINQHLKKKTIAKTEVVRWKGALDEEVEGILYYPHNYEAGKKYPLVVMIHGGPASLDMDEWDESFFYPANMMNQRGAFVLKPNYHGSSNYGLKFVESIGGGKYYDLEVPDIEKGVDWLISRNLVDPDKLGVMGWSNGAILTTALTVATTRYKAAAAGAGDVEWASDWGNAHFGASFDNYYFGKSPLEDPQLYIDKSPFYKLDRVRTPTIIFFGTEDTNVPTQQGWMHYRALQQLGKTDVRFLLFPGEKHGPQKLVHQRRKLEEELAWFDRYLFKTLKEENEAFKPDSPLAIALRLKAARADAVRYGRVVKGKLVPETIRQGAIELGRFEVTRAQYGEFDRDYKVEPGKENFPANNITFDQARAYTEWLARVTGEPYRLITEGEADQIYAAPSGPENTLDYWAGYAVNPDDAARLKSKIAELGRPASLLKEVGSFKGMGSDEMVFDLGGNVAEWVVGRDGRGRLVGGSADTPVDAKFRNQRAGDDYRGFRVAKGPVAEGAPAASR